jgi:general secretion pathway protein M
MSTQAMNTQMQMLRARWTALAPREKAMVAGAGGLIAFAIVWLIFVGPALSTLHSADTQRRTLDSQLQRMAALKSQAQTMQALPKQNRDEAVRQLELATRQRLGTSGRLAVSGDRVTVTLLGTPADALAQWLAQARSAAHALPAEAHLLRNATGTWDGNLVLALPRS